MSGSPSMLLLVLVFCYSTQLLLLANAFQQHRSKAPPDARYRLPASLPDNSNDNKFGKSPRDCLEDAMERMHILQEDSSGRNLLQNQCIRIGPSTIAGAGKGVFATKNIKAGTVVGFFPVHQIGLEQLLDTNTLATTATQEDQDYFDSQNEESDVSSMQESPGAHHYLHYLIGSRPLCGYQTLKDGGTLFVDVNPTRKVQEEWISHYINDGATVKTNSEKGLIEYYRLSTKRKNCVTIPFGPSPILATVTNSKVMKGQELFTTYGGSYWLDALLLESVNDDHEEATAITEKVQSKAKETALDLFDAMQSAKVTHAGLQGNLDQLFCAAKTKS